MLSERKKHLDHRHVLHVGTARHVSASEDKRTIEVELTPAALEEHPRLAGLQEEKLLRQLARLDPESLKFMSKVAATAEVSEMLGDAAEALESRQDFGLKLAELRSKTGFEKINFTVGGVPINMLKQAATRQPPHLAQDKDLKLNMHSLSLELAGGDPAYYYYIQGGVFNPDGPELTKKSVQFHQAIKMSEKEQTLVKTQAAALVRKAAGKYCRGGTFDELAGIPIEEWEGSMDRHLRVILQETIRENHPDNEQALYGKYMDFTFREFLRVDPAKDPVADIFANLGDDVGDRIQFAHGRLAARMYGEVEARVLKELLSVDRAERNPITNEFMARAVEKIRQSMK